MASTDMAQKINKARIPIPSLVNSLPAGVFPTITGNTIIQLIPFLFSLLTCMCPSLQALHQVVHILHFSRACNKVQNLNLPASLFNRPAKNSFIAHGVSKDNDDDDDDNNNKKV